MLDPPLLVQRAMAEATMAETDLSMVASRPRPSLTTDLGCFARCGDSRPEAAVSVPDHYLGRVAAAAVAPGRQPLVVAATARASSSSSARARGS